MQRVRNILAAVILCLLSGASLRAAEEAVERFEVFNAGNVTYSNVLIMNKTRTDVFFRHPQGLASVKVKDLDKTTQLQLGYHLVLEPTAADSRQAAEPRNMLARLKNLDPRYQELADQVVWETEEFVSKLDRRVIYGAIGGVFLLYLFFCYCCQLVCRKTGQPASPLVWLPWFKLLPLLRAAGMRPWWFVTTLLPGINLITYVVWAFKIARARGKGAGVTVMLLLPLFNVLAFFYLAFADSLGGDQQASSGPRKFVTLSQSPRRHAA